LRGWKIDFEGSSKLSAYLIIKKMIDDYKDPTEAYVRENRPT
jgi:hypothetical protein